MICGFVGAGKTTFARKLEEETGAVRITKDEWLVSIFGNNPAKDTFKDYDDRVTRLAIDFAFRLVAAGVDVIIDDFSWIKADRKEMRERILRAGAKPVLYFVDKPIEEMRRRVAERSKNPPADSFVISDELFSFYLDYWQPPGDDEEFVRVG